MDERHVVPGVRFACDAYVDFCRRRPWVEAVASSLTELFAPDLMGRRIAGFEREYPWIDAEALGYFPGRLTQAPRDSEHGLEIVLYTCSSRAPNQRCTGRALCTGWRSTIRKTLRPVCRSRRRRKRCILGSHDL